MITREEVKHCQVAVRLANMVATRLFVRMVSGESLPPDADVSGIIAYVDMLHARQDNDMVLTMRHLWQLGRAVAARSRARRAIAEREGAGLWSPAAIQCYASLALLAIRVLTQGHCVSLLRLQPVLRYIHQ